MLCRPAVAMQRHTTVNATARELWLVTRCRCDTAGGWVGVTQPMGCSPPLAVRHQNLLSTRAHLEDPNHTSAPFGREAPVLADGAGSRSLDAASERLQVQTAPCCAWEMVQPWLFQKGPIREG